MKTYGNGENDIDLKGAAEVVFRKCLLEGYVNAMHESITLHKFHIHSKFHDCDIIVKNTKGILNLAAGTALFDTSRFSVPHEGWWNLDDGPRYPPLLDGTLLGLTCQTCLRV